MKPKLMRQKLSMPGLIEELKNYFKSIVEPVSNKGKISLSDCLLSGLAIFSLKYPSGLNLIKANEKRRPHIT
jgi:hypothetical protein